MIGKSKIQAVDFGSSHVRILGMSLKDGHPVISYYNEIDISTVQPEKRVDAIKTEGKQFFKNIPSRRVLISLPGKGILTRTILTPKIASKKIKDILKFEIQQQIPFPIEVVAWSYQIFSEIENNFQVILCAIKKDLVNEFISHFHSFSLDIEYLETDFFALYNLFRFSPYFDENKCQGILEIGASSSNLIIFHKGRILMRALTTSGDTITSSISEVQQIEFGEAERMKIEKGLDLPAVSSAIESIQREIQNSVDYWRYTIKGEDISEIYVCGGNAKMNGISEFFSEKTKVSFHILNPLEFIEIAPQYEEILKGKSAELAVACGIALRQLKSTFIDINMIPFELTRIKEFKSSIPYIFLSLFFAVLLIMTPGFFMAEKKVILQNFSKQVDAALKRYEKYKPDVDKLNASIGSLEDNISTEKGLLKKKYVWLERILEIGNTLPSNRIYLTSITPGAITSKKPSAPGAPSAPPGMPSAPPGMPSAPPGAPSAPRMPSTPVSTVSVSTKTLTLKGEIIVTNLKTAFKDLETFVQKLSTIQSFSSITIQSVELNPENDKLNFVLLVQLK